MTFVTPVPGGVRLRIRVQPRASRTEVAGPHGDELKIRLAAPPVDGAANDMLIRFLAGALEVPRAAVTIVGGLASRSKVVYVTGISPAQVGAALRTPR